MILPSVIIYLLLELTPRSVNASLDVDGTYRQPDICKSQVPT